MRLHVPSQAATSDGRDIDGGYAQDKLAELGLIKLEPCRPGDEDNEWEADELYYPTAPPCSKKS